MSLNATLASIATHPVLNRTLTAGRWISAHLPRKQSLADRGAQQLNLERKAQSDILQSEALAATDSLSGTEAEIAHWCDEQLNALHRKAQSAGDRVRRLQSKLDLKSSIANLHACEARAQAAVNAQLAKQKGALLQAWERGEQREREYDQFRKRNRLERDYIGPRQRWLFIGAIALLALLVCSLAFYWHWQQQLDVRAAAGVIVAVGLGFSLLPALAGYFWLRETNHHSPSRFLAGVIGAIVGVVGLLLGAIGFSLYLDSANSQNLMGFLEAFYQSPAVLLPLNWPLIGTLMAAGLASMLAGYSLEDPYPGFDDHQRRKTAAQRAYFSLAEQLHSKATSITADQQERARAEYRQATRPHNRYRSAMASYRKSYQRYLDHADTVEQAGNLMLERFRQLQPQQGDQAMDDGASYAPRYQPKRSATLQQQMESLQTADNELEQDREMLDTGYREAKQDLEYLAASLLNEVEYLPERTSADLQQEQSSSAAPRRRLGRLHLASGR